MNRIVSTAVDGSLKLQFDRCESPLESNLKDDEVVIRVEAAPINPSDIGSIFGPVQDFSEKNCTQTKDSYDQNILTCKVHPKLQGYIQGRAGKLIPCGNEGAGVVVKAGAGKRAQSLMGKVVSVAGGKMFAEYRKLNINMCIVHNDGVSPRQAASSYVNPMTVLGFVENLRRDNHSAMIHTAAASNLGQMLQKVCLEENIPLVNIVRKQEQEDILRSIGAKYVVRSDKPSFMKDLVQAIKETKATIAFDAIGGGTISNTIMQAMEAAALAETGAEASPYGSDTFKQLYIYGGLDRSETKLSRGFGMSWAMGGWLMPRFLATLDPSKVMEMTKHVADNINTLFKSEYVAEISLNEAIQREIVEQYAKQETGKKYLVNPSKQTSNI